MFRLEELSPSLASTQYPVCNSFEVTTEEARNLIYVMDAAGFLRDHADGGGAEQLYWRSGGLPVGQ